MNRLVDLVGKHGMTSRSAHHWIRAGYVGDVAHRGSGYDLELTDEQAIRLLWIARLVQVGFTPAKAAEIARVNLKPITTDAPYGEYLGYTLAPGIHLALRVHPSPLET